MNAPESRPADARPEKPAEAAAKAVAPGGAEVSRRRFLVVLLGATGVLGLAGLLAPIARYALPTAKAEVATKIKVSTLADLTVAGG